MIPHLLLFSLVVGSSFASPHHGPRQGERGGGKHHDRDHPSCKVFPGDAHWPGAGSWGKLNQTIGGRLSAVVPLPSVCHDGKYGAYNADQCTALKAAWLLDTTYLNNAAEVMNPGVQNYTCVPYTPQSQTCAAGEYPAYSIRVTGAQDVIAGVKFAHKNNVRLVIKNTGHDFAGKSTGAGALSLWTHNLNTIEIITVYNAKGYSGPAVKLGAGTIGGDVYSVVGKAGYRVIGGTCPTVGIAGGYTSGGGHSLLNGAYGMAADNVLEYEVVLADGTHTTASQTKNRDLYWALSGGGAGTFAVVISMTTKIFKDGPVGSGIFAFNMTSDIDNYWGAVSDLWSFLPTFVDAGPNTWDFALTPTGFQAFAITVPDKTGEDVGKLLAPVFANLTKRGIPYSWTPTNSANYLAYFSSRFGPGILGAGPATVQLASRLIPRAGIEDETQRGTIIDAMKAFNDAKYWTLGCHALNVGKASHPDNAVLPAWRKAIANCNIVSYWDWDVAQTEMAARKHLLTGKLMPGLEAATPGAGTYLNEIDYQWQGDWQKELYAENYPKLSSIKNKYDPDSVFYAWTAVGSEKWVKEVDGRLCRISA